MVPVEPVDEPERAQERVLHEVFGVGMVRTDRTCGSPHRGDLGNDDSVEPRRALLPGHDRWRRFNHSNPFDDQPARTGLPAR